MLSVADKLTIQYVVEEAVAAGLTDALMVPRPQRTPPPPEVHFDRHYERDSALHKKGDAWDGATFIGATLLPPYRGAKPRKPVEQRLTAAARSNSPSPCRAWPWALGPGPGGPAARCNGVVFPGSRYDTGDRIGYPRAVIRLAAEHEDLGPGFRSCLRAFVRQEMPS